MNNVLTNRLKSVTYNDGSKYKFEYDSTTVSGKHFLTTVKDADDRILEEHEYDNQSRAKSSQKHGGVERYELNYINEGTVGGVVYTRTEVTDARENLTKYYSKKIHGTNVVWKTEGVCASCGGSEVTNYVYDESNSWLNLKKKTDALGHETVYTYDSDRNITSIRDIMGTQSFTHNPFGQVLEHTDRMGGIRENVYDTAGNLLTTTDALDETTTFSYTTAHKQLASITDARGKSTIFYVRYRRASEGCARCKPEIYGSWI